MSKIDKRLERAKEENRENHTVEGWRVTYEQDVTQLKADLLVAEKDAKEWELVAENNRTEADKTQADLKLCKDALRDALGLAKNALPYTIPEIEQALNPKENKND